MDEIKIQIPENVQTILRVLETVGYEAYIVGGCVRDALLGKTPHDWDVCTNALPQSVCNLFESKGYHVIQTGIKHGTVTVLAQGTAYEITTYRIDGDYSDYRRPDSVSFTLSLEADLARRDFTINAMAYNPETGLVDPFHGQEDLLFGLIRCVGDPAQRFQEDGLRVMRAIRFASTYRFALEPETDAMLHAHAKLLEKISAERLRDELCKMLMGDDIENVLLAYRDVLAVVIPELEITFDFPQNNPWHCYDVYRHIAASVSRSKRDLTIRLTMLLHDIGKPVSCQTDEKGIDHFPQHSVIGGELAGRILTRLRFDHEMGKKVTELVRVHDAHLQANGRSVRRMMNKLGPEQFARLLDVNSADIAAHSESCQQTERKRIRDLRCAASHILSEKQAISLKDLKISGRDLIAAGMNPGPKMGNLFNELMEFVLNHPEMNEKETLLEEARQRGYLANQENGAGQNDA